MRNVSFANLRVNAEIIEKSCSFRPVLIVIERMFDIREFKSQPKHMFCIRVLRSLLTGFSRIVRR